MLDIRSTQNSLHTITINFTLQEYFFVLQVVLGEDMCVAYANTFDSAEFKRNIPSEDEDEYLAKFKKDAQNLLDTQQCRRLREILEDDFQSEIQAKATTLTDFKFTGNDIQQLLANLLRNRSETLDEASVRDILALIKSMYDTGALDSGDSFSKHFIQVYPPFNALCTTCNREFDAYPGMDCKCPHCNQVYKWSEQEKRFYPNTIKL